MSGIGAIPYPKMKASFRYAFVQIAVLALFVGTAIALNGPASGVVVADLTNVSVQVACQRAPVRVSFIPVYQAPTGYVVHGVVVKNVRKSRARCGGRWMRLRLLGPGTTHDLLWSKVKRIGLRGSKVRFFPKTVRAVDVTSVSIAVTTRR